MRAGAARNTPGDAPARHIAAEGHPLRPWAYKTRRTACQRARSPPAAAGAQCRVVASKSHLNAETREFIARFSNTDLVQAGSSLKFCRVAEGNADIYPRLAPTCEWDTAAAQAVLEGAGGHVFDVYGSPLRYGKADVLNPSFIASAAPFAALPMQG
jgi:3'(2'), 5'-bisphosphate nucleotidase